MTAGCAAPVAQPAGSNTASVCERETPTGSIIPVTRCRTAEEVAREQAAARATGDDINRARSGLRGPNTQ
jgi:hypothetical protein